MKGFNLNEFIVFEGPELTIEWYFKNRGKSQAKNYFEQLHRKQKLEAFELFMTMARLGKILNMTKFRYEGDGIYAFKPHPHRFLCFFYSGKKIIISNAFQKKTVKLPISEKRCALTFQNDYKIRVEKGIYYDNY